jgi:hypothetical protein
MKLQVLSESAFLCDCKEMKILDDEIKIILKIVESTLIYCEKHFNYKIIKDYGNYQL